jgi:hypothetical protein
MKTFYTTIKIAVGFCLVAMLAASCVPKSETLGGAGNTLIKYTPGDKFTLLAIEALSTSQKFNLLNVKRDLPNTDALNTTSIVTLTLDTDTSMIKKYNKVNGTSFIPMPPALYSTTPAVSGGKITFTFNPGDFDNTLVLTIPNASLFDFGKSYMLCFKMTMTGEGKVSQNVCDTIYRQIMAKNRFDGSYSVTGTLVDAYNSAISGNYPMTVKLVTTGKNQVRFEEPADAPWGSVIYHSITSAGAMSVYGSFGLIVNFDDANNVASIVNYYGQPAGNTRSAVLDASGINKYNAGSKVVNIKYFMRQPSLCPDPPYVNNVRTSFDETWTYTGPR